MKVCGPASRVRRSCMPSTSGWLITSSLIRRLVNEDRPLFGACFGHQAIAKALGGAVCDNPGPFVLGVVETRATMRATLADQVKAATERELEIQTRLRKTEDFKEGIKATSERRVPNFMGR